MPNSPRVRVFVADDHPVYREGVMRAIQGFPEFELVGSAENGRAALDAIRELEPDVAVIDFQMPELDGGGVLNAIQRDGIATRVVLLSGSFDSGIVYQAVAAGVAAFLSKESGTDRICDAVAQVARGETVISPEATAELAAEVQARAGAERPRLSPRELEVLSLTAQGMSGPEIGKHLHLSAATIKSHMQSVYEKLGVSDRAAAVAEGMRRGLVE